MFVTRIMVVYKNFLKVSDVVPDLCTFMKPTEIFFRVKIVLKNTCNKVPALIAGHERPVLIMHIGFFARPQSTFATVQAFSRRCKTKIQLTY